MIKNNFLRIKPHQSWGFLFIGDGWVDFDMVKRIIPLLLSTGGSLVMGIDRVKTEAVGEQVYMVTAPPAALNLDPFYKKYISAKGYPIISSGKVSLMSFDDFEAWFYKVCRSLLNCPRTWL